MICALTAAFDTEPLGTNFDHFARNLIPRSPQGAKSSCPADTPDPRPRGAPAIKTCFCCSLQKRGRGVGLDQCCVSPLSVRARLAIPTIHHPPPSTKIAPRRRLPRPVSNFSCALCVVLGIDRCLAPPPPRIHISHITRSHPQFVPPPPPTQPSIYSHPLSIDSIVHTIHHPPPTPAS